MQCICRRSSGRCELLLCQNIRKILQELCYIVRSDAAVTGHIGICLALCRDSSLAVLCAEACKQHGIRNIDPAVAVRIAPFLLRLTGMLLGFA